MNDTKKNTSAAYKLLGTMKPEEFKKLSREQQITYVLLNRPAELNINSQNKGNTAGIKKVEGTSMNAPKENKQAYAKMGQNAAKQNRTQGTADFRKLDEKISAKSNSTAQGKKIGDMNQDEKDQIAKTLFKTDMNNAVLILNNLKRKGNELTGEWKDLNNFIQGKASWNPEYSRMTADASEEAKKAENTLLYDNTAKTIAKAREEERAKGGVIIPKAFDPTAIKVNPEREKKRVDFVTKVEKITGMDYGLALFNLKKEKDNFDNLVVKGLASPDKIQLSPPFDELNKIIKNAGSECFIPTKQEIIDYYNQADYALVTALGNSASAEVFSSDKGGKVDPQKVKDLALQGFSLGGSVYEDNGKFYRVSIPDENKIMEERHPTAYFVGDATGSLLPSKVAGLAGKAVADLIGGGEILTKYVSGFMSTALQEVATAVTEGKELDDAIYDTMSNGSLSGFFKNTSTFRSPWKSSKSSII